MAEAADLRHAVGAVSISHGQLTDLEVELRSAEEQIEVTERVEVSEVGAIGLDALVIGAPDDLRSTQGIGDPLLQDPGENETEGSVPEDVQEPHRLAFHWIHESSAGDEISLALHDRGVELREILGVDREVRTEDHEH